MKKTLVKLGTVFMSVAMLFTMTGCDSRSEIEKELDNYTQYNHIVVEDGKIEETINYYYNGEEANDYDYISSSESDDFFGYKLSITGRNECELSEEYEIPEEDKGFIYLDKYKVTDYKHDKGTDLKRIVSTNVEGYFEYPDFEKTEENGKKTYTSKDDKARIVVEDKKITSEVNTEQGKFTTVLTFDKIDDNYYSNIIDTIHSLDGATRAEVKEKLGQFIIDNKKY
mgnify:FL=1